MLSLSYLARMVTTLVLRRVGLKEISNVTITYIVQANVQYYQGYFCLYSSRLESILFYSLLKRNISHDILHSFVKMSDIAILVKSNNKQELVVFCQVPSLLKSRVMFAYIIIYNNDMVKCMTKGVSLVNLSYLWKDEHKPGKKHRGVEL